MILKTNLLKEIAASVAVNDHGNAIVVGARALGETELAELVENINRQQLRLGHLPPLLYEKRHAAYERLMECARKSMSPSDFKRFHQVF